MAPLTWQNVTAPNDGGAAALFSGAAQSLQGGINMFSGGLENFQDRRAKSRSNSILAELSRVQGEGDVNGFLSNVAGRIGGQDITSELASALVNLRGTALGFDTTRTNTELARNADGRAAGRYGMEVGDRNRRIAQEDQLAALAPQLARIREDAYRGGAVQNTAIVKGLPFNERELLARTLMAEAGSEGFAGMLAAGAVIDNRVRSGSYGKGLQGVILKPGQFSAWNSLTGYANGEQGQDMMNIKANADAYAAADAILSGKYEDPTKGATHYYNPSISQPKWGNGGKGFTRIGNHIFGNADGNVGSDNGTRVSDLIKENNNISPDVLLGLIDDNYNARVSGNKDRDANRLRDFNFDRSLEGARRNDIQYNRDEANRIETKRLEDEAQAARELALAALRNNPTIEEAQRELVNNPDLDERELAAAMGRLSTLTEDGSAVITTPKANLTGERLSDLNSTTVVDDAVATLTAKTNFDLTSNDMVRINRRAEEVIGDTDPVQYLRNAIPGLQNNQGQVAAILNRVAQQNEVSPAQAAVLLEETIRNRNGTGRFFRDWAGKDRLLDEEAANALASEVYSPEAIRDAAIVRQNAERNISEITGIRDQIAQIDSRLNLTRDRGMPDDPALLERRAALIEAAQRMTAETAPVPVAGPRGDDTPLAPPAPAADAGRVGNATIEQVQTFNAVVERYPSAAAVLQSDAPPAQKIQVINRLIDVVEGDIFMTNAQRQEQIAALEAVRSNFQN